MLDRRTLIASAAATLAAGHARLAWASASTDRRLVVVILRGAMDGLSAVPALGDPDYVAARKGLAIPPPAEAGGALPLDGFFGLHPALSGLSKRYADKELVVFHAIATPYRDRSHFDGQNLLESGATKPFGLTDGWLNRALGSAPKSFLAGRKSWGVALSPALPLILDGKAPVMSWSPSILPQPEADLVLRARALFQRTDRKLAQALDEAARSNTDTGEAPTGKGGESFPAMMAAAARFLAEPDGPCVAVLQSTGWDTHANQAGALTRNLTGLDKGVDALASGLGARWSDTAVLVVTEFGRTVAMNGTAGSDHGTAGAAFLTGGAVAGGRVIADWPGLKTPNLYESRDLKATTDLRSLFKAALGEHLGAPRPALEQLVFPDSQSAKPIQGLFRA
jgi:uncharacterized protein (DUF1501 family)